MAGGRIVKQPAKVIVTKPDSQKSGKQLAQKALRKIDKLEDKIEKKYFTDSYPTALSTTFAIFGMTFIGQGDTGTTRDGNVIFVRSVRLRILLTPSGNSDTPSMVRLIVFRDNQQNVDVAPTASDLVLTTTNFNSMYNKAEQKRFKIYYDKTFDTNARSIAYDGATTLTYEPSVFKDKWIFPNCNVYYNGASTSDIQKNGLYVAIAKSSAMTVTPDIQFQVCFNDA